MKIGLDYDGTVTRDIVLWLQFCILFRQLGHQVYLVTMRYPSEMADVPEEFLRNLDGVFPTSRQAKQQHMLDNDIVIDIWIDDNPRAVYMDAKEAFPTVAPEGFILNHQPQS
jgi:hypothetical protein